MLRFLIILYYLLFFSDVAYAKDYLGLMNDLEKAKEANISVDLDSKSKQYGYKNFKSFVKDFKKKNNIKRLSTEDARIYFAGYDPTLQIIESKENLDKLHELILNNNTLKRHTSYFKKKNSDKVKWLAVAVDYKKEMAKITKDFNLEKISPFPWGWSPNYAGAAIINCEREKYSLGIKIGPECILVDISKNKEHLNVILPIDKIEMCKENSQRLFPDLYKIADKEFRDKRYKSYCQSILFSLPGIPDNERTPNLIKKQIKKNEFLYSKLEENNPLLIKVKKDEEEKRKLEQAKLEAKRKADEEKKKLEAEKIKQQKALDEKKLSLLSAKPPDEKAKKVLIDIQKFIKNNPDEFDILEISEFFIKTRPILDNSFNEQLEKDLDSLIEYVKKSSKVKSYLKEIEIKEREKDLKYIDETLSLINKQIAKVKNFLYEKPNSIHAENWLNSVKKAKQRLNNSNSLDKILESRNELSILISNQETLVRLTSESEELILELKDYLTENLTTDLTPKILEKIENLKKSIESESYDNLNKANDIVKIFLEPKRKTDREELLLKQKKERLALQKKAKKKAEAKKKKIEDQKGEITNAAYISKMCIMSLSNTIGEYKVRLLNQHKYVAQLVVASVQNGDLSSFSKYIASFGTLHHIANTTATSNCQLFPYTYLPGDSMF